ncbi:sodium/hydrogen exchanger 6 isoform X2 [Planococcus citri]|uniref:sodium/hydrogen exchanger 6 isoform X2 n=1 Tax=Planococcus citri TaxID=170843 RepID=UPI0031F99B6B
MPSFYAPSADIELDAKAQWNHRLDSLNLLVYTLLLTLTVLTIWMFKHRRLRFLHESGLSVIYGLIVGAIIRYTVVNTPITHLQVHSADNSSRNLTLPPDDLWLGFSYKGENKTYSYKFHGEVTVDKNDVIDLKATFDPEIFFNIILPPIIFHAGYSLKKKYFFKNFGAILTYALLGTAISSFVVGFSLYFCVQLMPHLKGKIQFLDSLFFGALISPTDPLTILAIFNDLRVDVNLYSLVFGESVLNDAVALVLSGSIQNYSRRTPRFDYGTLLLAFQDFVSIFFLSLATGAALGCITALMTKFTRLKDFPLLESALFVLMSYSSFLIAEVADLTGVVAVLFCGICQAHYTYNNLSSDSRRRTKRFFELLNFLAESFIFSYIGVSMFTFPKHQFDIGFILCGFLCAALGRAANIYPLSFILNLGRKPKIPSNFQHMLFFSGIRGAMSFALAIRNTVSDARQKMLTTTSLIVIATVIIQGGAALPLLNWFKIPTGVDEEIEALPEPKNRREESPIHSQNNSEKSFLARIWGNFDVHYMKPLLTQSNPTLIDTLPTCLGPVARLLTTTEQLTQSYGERSRSNSEYGTTVEPSVSRHSLQSDNAKEKVYDRV